MLSNPKTLSLIQQTVAGERPSQASGNNAVSGNGSNTLAAHDDEQEGQLVEIKFKAFKPGKFSLQLQCMSGGCGRASLVRLDMSTLVSGVTVCSCNLQPYCTLQHFVATTPKLPCHGSCFYRLAS